MANLAEKHHEEKSAQLADSEISRILSALQKAEFKRSETGNARPDQRFKPRSLMEIAETVRQQDEAVKAAAITAEIAAHKAAHPNDEAADNIVDDIAAGPVDALTDDKAPETKGDDQSHEQKTVSALDRASQDAGLAMPPTEASASDPQDLPVKDADVDAGAGIDNGADNAIDLGSPTSPFETAQAAYDRGYGDGVQAGREATEAELRAAINAEFEAKFADKINAFETALIGLAKPQTVDTGALSKSLQAAVIRLAVARTGAVIDEMPELMVTRIESLADAAGKNVAAGQVFMHPDDCALIAPVMAARQEPVMIDADPALQRGDIRIRFDGIDIDDLLDRRIGLSHSMASPLAETAADQQAQTPPTADDEAE